MPGCGNHATQGSFFTYIVRLSDVVAALHVANDLVLLRPAARERNAARLARSHGRRRTVEVHIAVPAKNGLEM